MIPKIPDNCERFKIDNGVAKFLDGNIWANVSLRMRSGRQSGSAANLCNAARCAWLDEAERIAQQQGSVILSNEVYNLLCLTASDDIDVGEYPQCKQWEIDYAHCLAWAEAWAREAAN